MMQKKMNPRFQKFLLTGTTKPIINSFLSFNEKSIFDSQLRFVHPAFHLLPINGKQSG